MISQCSGHFINFAFDVYWGNKNFPKITILHFNLDMQQMYQNGVNAPLVEL